MAQKISELVVDINVTGVPQATSGLAAVESKGKSATGALAGLSAGAAAAGLSFAGLAAGAAKFLSAAEEYNRINSRLALVTKNSTEAAGVQAQLFASAQKTGVEFESIASQYSRISLAAKDLGASQGQVVKLVEAVNKSLQISGSSAAEAAGSSTQFVQALSSGKLQAEELNSILDGNSFLARMIAEGMGLTVGGLREAVKEGTVLGSTVLDAVLSRTREIDTAFEKLGTSMERSGTRLENSFDKALSAIDRKIGVSKSLSALFEVISASLDQGVVRSVGALIMGGRTGLIESLIESQTPSSSRPLVGRAGQLAPVRVTANAPRPGTGRSNRTASTVDLPSQLTPIGRGLQGGATSGVSGLQGAGALIQQTLADTFGSKSWSDEMADLGSRIGTTFVDSIAVGISTGVQSGSFSEGFRALTGTLIGGLGRLAIDFGSQSLLLSGTMAKLRLAFASFNPIASAAASVGLIALGSVMVGLGQKAARSSFGGAGRSDGFSGGGFSIPSSVSSSAVFGAPSSIIADGRTPITSDAGSRVTAASPMIFNIIGPNDPTAQRAIRELIRNADGRGSF